MTRQMLFHQLLERIKIIDVFDLVWQSVPDVNEIEIENESKFETTVGLATR